MARGHKDKHNNFHPHNIYGKRIRIVDFDHTKDTNIKWRVRSAEELHRFANGRMQDFIDTTIAIFKISVPAVAQFDPHFQTAYVLFQFAQYCYQFIKKVIENYRLNGGHVYNAISSQVTSEIQEKIYPYFADKLFEKIAEIITDWLWNNCRVDTNKVEFYFPIENRAKQVMTDEISLMLKGELRTHTKTELERNLWEAYFEELLKEELSENETNIEREMASAVEDLADLLVSEDQIFASPSSIITGVFDAKNWLETRISDTARFPAS